MKRFGIQRLKSWKESSHHKPLIIRGARQVGKTHLVRQLGAQFDHFVEINFEYEPHYKRLFLQDLDPQRIVKAIELLIKRPIRPGKTLLFFDEIQSCPDAINSLRYFYEKMPDLHVIAAGSLLEFANELIGLPVGRVQSFYLYPMSFIEYLVADGEEMLAEEILSGGQFSEVIHEKLLRHLGVYMAIGGMPEVVKNWIARRDVIACQKVLSTLLESYRQDFQKYAKKLQVKYLNLLFDTIPRQLTEKFLYSRVGEYRKRELEPSLELLLKANLLHKVTHTAAQGIPIGAEANPEKFKLLFLDVGLTQALLELDLSSWFIEPELELVNKGKVVEAFVGQELLAYSDPEKRPQLHYWQRNSRGSSAEVDYVIQKNQSIIPIEVKAGRSKHLTSLYAFCDSHPNTSKAIKFSIEQIRQEKLVNALPLYNIVSYSPLRDEMKAWLQTVQFQLV